MVGIAPVKLVLTEAYKSLPTKPEWMKMFIEHNDEFFSEIYRDYIKGYVGSITLIEKNTDYYLRMKSKQDIINEYIDENMNLVNNLYQNFIDQILLELTEGDLSKQYGEML